MRVPITVVTGPLGSGKTTLLRHLLDRPDRRFAIVMNEFGEIAIDSKIIEGKNVCIAELAGGCVCCSLLGEFEAAVDEIIRVADPDHILLETTGVAEPSSVAFDIQENLPQLRLDGVVAVVDADGLVKYPSLGRTTRAQIEDADLILLNRVDLISAEEEKEAIARLSNINSSAEILKTIHSRVDPDLLLGIARDRPVAKPHAEHQPEFQYFVFRSSGRFRHPCLEEMLSSLNVYRVKGFIYLGEQYFLLNFVHGRWDLEEFKKEGETELVFFDRNILHQKEEIIRKLKECEE